MSDFVEMGRFVLQNVVLFGPSFLLSILLSVLVRTLKLEGAIRRVFSQQIGVSILLAAAVGAFSPFCSCTVIPIVSALLLSGVPLAPVMAFWIASPTMDPEIFALTVGILDWPLAIVRLVATLLLSVGAGYLTLALTRSGILGKVLLAQETAASCSSTGCSTRAAQPVSVAHAGGPTLALAAAATAVLPNASTCSLEDSSCGVPSAKSGALWSNLQELDWRKAAREILNESWQIGRWLLLAFALEALILRFVPQTAIAAFLGGENLFAIPFAALVGVPLYLSNITALPIVSGLLDQGMQPGAAVAFLIAGPVTTLPAMTAVWGIVQPRVFALYLAIGVIGAMLLGLIANLVLAG